MQCIKQKSQFVAAREWIMKNTCTERSIAWFVVVAWRREYESVETELETTS